MKIDLELQNLLFRFVENNCSKEESKRVVDYFKKNKLSDEYPTVEQVMILLKKKDEIKGNEGFKILNKIKSEINQQERNRVYKMSRKLLYWKYTAAVILFIGIGYLFQFYYATNEPIQVIPEDSITLQLENGDIKIITENGKTKVTDSKGSTVGIQNGNQLVYDKEIEKEVLEYNTLTVPYGRRFEILLSDGTKVDLNAGTSLKYPIKFIEGENREVFLIGEAFFEVAEDKDHPFIVNTDELNIRVLGTSFNVSAYPEDSDVNAVLVEGMVSVYKNEISYDEKTAFRVDPGYKASLNRNHKNVSIEQVDLSLYTAWIGGKIIFKHLSFKNIIKKLERQYDVTIENNNIVLGEELFSASFDIENIEQVFQTLNKAYPIDFHINENAIIIN